MRRLTKPVRPATPVRPTEPPTLCAACGLCCACPQVLAPLVTLNAALVRALSIRLGAQADQLHPSWGAPTVAQLPADLAGKGS